MTSWDVPKRRSNITDHGLDFEGAEAIWDNFTTTREDTREDHRNFVHPKVAKPITISGSPGDDAKHYQVRAVRRALEESKS